MTSRPKQRRKTFSSCHISDGKLYFAHLAHVNIKFVQTYLNFFKIVKIVNFLLVSRNSKDGEHDVKRQFFDFDTLWKIRK